MVEAHRVHRVEAREVVLVGIVVAVPRDDVERRMVELRAPQVPRELGDDFRGRIAILVGGDGREEIARIGEAVGADRAQLGEAEGRAIVLADVAACRALDLGAELDAARHHRDLAGSGDEAAEFGRERERALLGDDEELAIGVVAEAALFHGAVGRVDVDRRAALRERIAARDEGREAGDEVGGLLGKLERPPAQAVERRLHFVARRGAHPPLAHAPEGLVHRRGTQPIEPRPQVMRARRRERRARQLLGIQVEGDLLRGVLPDRQRALARLGLVMGAEAGEVFELRGGGAVVHEDDWIPGRCGNCRTRDD